MLPFFIRKQILKFLDSIGNERIWESETVKLLNITLNNDLKFDQHLNNVCLIVNRKLSTLSKIKKYLDFKRMWIFFKAIFESQFKYCPLTWMFCSWSANNRINHLQEKALWLVYDDDDLTFDVPLEKDRSFNIHHYNVQTLFIELFKVYYNLSQTICFLTFSCFYYLRCIFYLAISINFFKCH